MRLLPKKSDKTDPAPVEANAEDAEQADTSAPGRGYTPAKGRPTPKRRDAQGGKRGPVSAPQTQREAMKRSRGNKEDREASKEARRKAAAARREGMAAGDDRYLLPRDKGPVRAHVRDLVDSRRNLAGLFMPLAGLIFVALLIPVPAVANAITIAATLLLLAMLLEGLFTGRAVVKRVRQKFPDAKNGGLSLGWYAFVRSTQIRRIRIPKPRIKPGEPLPKK